MAILKCKMCGGDILLSEDKTTGTCDHCGSTMTFPRVSDEQKLNLYNRANHFRRQNEFDKAITAYERILDQDDTDAEAHWGAVLSRYGIEYVEDPVTHERIPTCHRVQISSILSDGDYLAALENAPDTASRNLYKQEAHRIAEIQKGILSISSQEKPYDVFICYKETDDSGSRTKDSTLAQEIYYQLTNEGYKVFFSRITLEDKLGTEYEPYIFAALNSAKVMLVVGTKPEYFNAVWVKNEWSRYLALMKNDRSRLLIPCYRDMDPYDLPEELSALQSQDMSKIGFVQDLIRGVKKVLDSKKPAETKPAAPQVTATGANIENLMKRAYLFMEDGDFKSANEYLDKVLDENAEYAPAYEGKVCTALGFSKEEQLAEATFLFTDHPDWKKALRFATPQQKTVYEGYEQQVKVRVEKQLRDYAYDCALEMAVNPRADRKKLEQEMVTYRASCGIYSKGRADGSRRQNAVENEAQFRLAVVEKEPGQVSEQNYQMAADMFRVIGDDDAAVRFDQCTALAEFAREKVIYGRAADKSLQRLSAAEWDRLGEQFLTVPDFKDARVRAEACREKAESIRNDLYKEAQKAIQDANDDSDKWKIAQEKLSSSDLNDYRDVNDLRKIAKQRYQECVTAEEEARQQAKLLAERKEAAAKARQKRNTFFATFAAILTIAVLFVVTQVIIPGNNYQKAVALQQSGRYEEAITAFEALNGYSDSVVQIEVCRNSIKERDYQAAVALQQAGKYEEAITVFEALNGYSDSATQINVCQNIIKARDYQAAVQLQETGKYEEAITVFEALNGYGDSAAKIEACRKSIKERDYQAAIALQQSGKYEEAITAFESLNGYSDSAVQITETKYLKAKALTAKGDYAGAATIFIGIKVYKDVESMLENDHNLAAAARDAEYSVGNYVTFGHYPQTSASNDSSPIEWLVLEKDGSIALLISRYGLDAQPYNKEPTNITWEKSMLRSWLNGAFLNKAFTAREKTCIMMTNVDNSSSQGYSKWSTNSGNNTQDRIFLLSYSEANKYLSMTYDDSENSKPRVSPTEYALQAGAWTSGSNKTANGVAAGGWWLRSPGQYQNNAACVTSDGTLGNYIVSYESACVRPALWINLNADIFN